MSWFNHYDYLFKTPEIQTHINNTEQQLPIIPTDMIDWVQRVRTSIEGKERILLPYMRDIMNDTATKKMIVGARQVGKSVLATDVLAHKATAFRNQQAVYCTYDNISLSLFSRQRLQIGTFSSNPILKLFIRNRLGNVGEISLKNGSTIYMVTDHGQYHHVEGRSPNVIVFDETQYQDVQYLEKSLQALSKSQGDIWVLGIGGEAGSAYEQLWEKTDQRQWVFDDPYWREKLKFDLVNGKMQLVVGDYLLDVMRGRWKPTKPSNFGWHGYNIPQEIDPFIPLTMDDAINKYSTDVIYSLEYKRKYLKHATLMAHVEAKFFRAVRRPITQELILSCTNRNYRLLTLDEIADIKDTFGEKVKITFGVDWGSGGSSDSVVAILIKWFIPNPKLVTQDISRIQLAYLKKFPRGNQFDQAREIRDMFVRAKCDIGVADLGYGHMQVKAIQEGGADSKGEWFDGVGANKFFGCRTLGTEVKPQQQFMKRIDEHGEEADSLRIDKTTTILKIINLMESKVVHPTHPFNEGMMRSKFMIPFQKEFEHQVDWIIPEWTSLTRKDIDEQVDSVKQDSRTYPKMEFNHPPDSLMAVIYANEGFDLQEFWNVISFK